MKVEIKVDTSKFDRVLSDLPDVMARARRVALNQIGNTVKNRAIDSFKDPQLRPSPWAPRKNNVDPERPLLYMSGNMRQGLKYRLEGDDTVVIGTPHEYLKYHQFGTKHMPARPVLPLDRYGKILPSVLRTIVSKVEKAFSAEIKKAFGR